MPLNIELLESSFNAVAPRADELADRFYERLFKEHPQVRDMFPEDMSEQKKHLISALAIIVQSLRDPDKLKGFLTQLGTRHVGYGVQPEHYPIVGQVLITTLGDMAQDAWTEELESAWIDGYGAVQAIIFETL